VVAAARSARNAGANALSDFRGGSQATGGTYVAALIAHLGKAGRQFRNESLTASFPRGGHATIVNRNSRERRQVVGRRNM
jgi:hypothetical protein